MAHSIPMRSCSQSWVLSAFADEAGDTCEEQIAAIKRAGLRHIDVRGIDGFNVSVLPIDKAKEIRKKLDAAGIVVNMLGSPIGKIDIADDFAIDMGKLRHLAGVGDALGCKAVRIFSYYNKNNEPEAKWRDEVFSRMSRLKAEAAASGLVLYHENEGKIFGENLARVKTLLGAMRDHSADKPGVFRAIFDFDNYNHANEDVWTNWLGLRDMTDAFHLKDSDKAKVHVPIGQGAGRAKEILADALARGWKGCLSLEPHLQHSKAVLATVTVTGMQAKENAKFSEMPRPDVFHVAATAAKELLGSIKATVA